MKLADVIILQAMEGVKQQIYKVGTTKEVLRTTGSGSSMDWARGALHIKYPYTVELRGHYGFITPAHMIETIANEAKAATFVFAQNASESE